VRLAPALLLFILAPAVAWAQPAQIERIAVTEYGLYTVDKQTCQRDEQGIQRCTRSNARHAATTWTVPAQIGVEFGLRYSVVGQPSGAPVSVRRVWVLPPPGFQPPGSNQPITRLERVDETAIDGSVFVSYGFDDAWELVPGPWVLQFWDGDRLIGSQTFTVVAH
jgi:hypothetical protein